jgi:hypothetical protein
MLLVVLAMCPEAPKLRSQADRCRRLAQWVDERDRKVLLAMASEYDAEADAIEQGKPRAGA